MTTTLAPRDAAPLPGDADPPLASWTALLDELARALVRQRDAVARDRVADVHASVDDLHRLLLRLELAMRSGATLLATRPAGAADLDSDVRAIRAAAGAVRREAAINREVLQRGLAAGERWLQELFTGLDLPGGYGPTESKTTMSGRFMDRRG